MNAKLQNLNEMQNKPKLYRRKTMSVERLLKTNTSLQVFTAPKEYLLIKVCYKLTKTF